MDYVSVVAVVSTGVALYLWYKLSRGYVDRRIDDIERRINHEIVEVTRSIESRVDDMDRYFNEQIVSEVKDLQRMISDNVESIDQESKLSDARYDGMIDDIFKRLEKLEERERVPSKR